MNLGVYICIRCAGIHRALGVHISKGEKISHFYLPSLPQFAQPPWITGNHNGLRCAFKHCCQSLLLLSPSSLKTWEMSVQNRSMKPNGLQVYNAQTVQLQTGLPDVVSLPLPWNRSNPRLGDLGPTTTPPHEHSQKD